MATSVTWNGSNYSIPTAGELNWSSLSAFLIDLGNNAAVAQEGKQAIRVATSSPVTVDATADYSIISDLTVAGAVAVNLPAGVDGQVFVIVDGKGDASVNNITITPNGAESIIEAASLVLDKDRESVALQYHAATTDWKILYLNRYPDDIDLTAEVTGTLPVANGGTNSNTALSNNRVMISSGGSIVEQSALTANRALASDASGLPVVSAVTDTELGYVSGVTSSIQTQLDGKVSDTGDTVTGDIIMDNEKGVLFREATGNGTDRVRVKAPAALAADVEFVLPNSNGALGQALVTDGTGNTSWQSVGGGGAGFLFNEVAGESPTRDFLADERVYDFEYNLTQRLVGWAKVPSSYSAGNQIQMTIAYAVESAGTDNVKMQTVATLIKSGEAVTSTTNQHTSTNGDDALSGTSNALNVETLDLTDGSGEINLVAVAAGDLIKVELKRVNTSGTEDQNDIQFLPSATEVTFS